jgi:hypothetical protein
MSDPKNGGQSLMLRCPACRRQFAFAIPSAASKDLWIVCGLCDHRLSTDEILNATAESLNDLVEQTRSRLSGGTPGKA